MWKPLFKIMVLALPFLSAPYLLGQKAFSRQEVREDLDVLKTGLEQSHYNLYALTSKEDFDRNFNQIYRGITQNSLSELEATSLLRKVIAKANTGHAEIFAITVNPYFAYVDSGGTLFPLEIAVENGNPLVRKNYSVNERLEPGTRILSIDGVPIEQILNEIYTQLSAETDYFRAAKMELFSFPRLYWQSFGSKESFEVEIEEEGMVSQVRVKAVKASDGYENIRTELITGGRSLKFFDSAAHLIPGNFSGDLNEFKKFIDSSFTAISKRGSPNLIIDLRYNAGGDDPFSDYLVSYIADRPFKWHSKFSLKSSKLLKENTRRNNDTTRAYFREILRRRDGEVYEYPYEATPPQPAPNRFNGEVYVLVNRQSYSMAVVCAGMIQDYGFGTIVGEETGDHPSLHAAQFYFTLPNTGVPVGIPKGYMVRVSGSTELKGVVPDIPIKDYLLDEEDEILDALLKRLGKAEDE